MNFVADHDKGQAAVWADKPHRSWGDTHEAQKDMQIHTGKDDVVGQGIQRAADELYNREAGQIDPVVANHKEHSADKHKEGVVCSPCALVDLQAERGAPLEMEDAP